jgi:hypothetical protein
MLGLDDPQIRHAFAESNIEAFDTADNARILNAVLREKSWQSSDVVAVSATDSDLVILTKAGLARASERGIFNKRVEVDSVPYAQITGLVRSEKVWKGSTDSGIVVRLVHTTWSRLSWTGYWPYDGWQREGPDANDTTAERDRVLSLLAGAVGVTPTSTEDIGP